MSWHHGDYIDLVSAAGTLIAAVVAAYAASQSNKSAKESRLLQLETRIQQQELHKFEKEKHLYDLLKADAERANDNAKQGYPSELTFSQASNVAYALDSARNRIREFLNGNESLNADKYKRYFRQQLAEEVNAYFHEMVPASLDRKNPSQAQIESQSLWIINRRYFNFSVCEDEDLDDEDI